MPAIMYCCDECFANAPEECGHVDRSKLRVTPDGNWLCLVCYEADIQEPVPHWSDLPQPPEYGPATT